MSLFREYAVAPQALAQAREIGLWGKTEKRLRRMARRSAPVTCDWGNRRFYDYVLQIEKGTVVAVSLVNFSDL